MQAEKDEGKSTSFSKSRPPVISTSFACFLSSHHDYFLHAPCNEINIQVVNMLIMPPSNVQCSGERPQCEHCQDFKISCYYADGKRDRAKNEMINLKTRVEIYENLLEQLKAQVDSAGQLAITKALQGLRSQDSASQILDNTRDGESLVSAEVGSTGSMDHIKEEINADNSPYPIGYMGKSSEVAWIQRVAKQLAEEADQDLHPGNGPGTRTKTSSRTSSYSCPSAKRRSYDSAVVDEEYQFQTPAYHLDDLSVSIAGGQVDPYLLPDRKVADQLIETYFTTFHPSFPIVSKQLFMEQYDTFFDECFPSGSSKRWLAMLNLKFAIGALYAKLINAEWKGSDAEHLKYFGRARLLCLDERSMLEVADLQQVQVIGLTAMYLLASNQTNRAWHVNGLAIRFAQTLGLNLRNDVQEFDQLEKELRVRIWHALYSLEHLICFMTGRPASIRDRDCSAPLPRPIDDEMTGIDIPDSHSQQYTEDTIMTPSSNSLITPNSAPLATPNSNTPSQLGGSNPRSPGQNTPDTNHFSTVQPLPHHSSQSHLPSLRSGLQFNSGYFLEHTKLNRITAEVLSSLYSPDTINRSWSDIQGIISQLELEIVKWRADLPPIWDFGKRHRSQIHARERMALAFQYHNARILINRPCLCRLNYRIPNESNRSRGFNRSAAATCIGGARETVALLPDEPDPVGLISVAPWWCLLHYLVSTGAILMVEISMRAEHNPQQAEGLLNDSKKIVRWLRAMSRDNIAAERSWAVLSKLLIVSAPKIGGDTSDVERDLDDAAVSSVKHQAHFAQDDFGGPPGQMGDVQDIFRGLLDDPFPFGNIPIHSPFDNLILVPGVPFDPEPQPVLPFSTPFEAPSDFPANLSYPVQTDDPSPLQPPPPAPSPDMPIEDCSQMNSRMQKRLSRGVSNISMPPPPTFPKWSTTDEYGMNHIGPSYSETAECGRADLEAAAGVVNSDVNPPLSPDKIRKRSEFE